MIQKSNGLITFHNQITLNNNSITSQNTYISAATSENTRKAYRSDIQHFLSWKGLLPATTEVIINYLEDHATSLNPRTLARRLIALRQWHITQGFNDPTSHTAVAKTLKGIKRIHGKPKKKAPGIFLEQLTVISNYLKTLNTLKSSRDNALLLIQFAGAFRVSEIISIEYEHLTFVDEGLRVLIPRSKTDQENEGKKILIPYTNKSICPASALKEWIEISSIHTGFIFRGIKKNGELQPSSISAREVNYIIQNVTSAAGLQFLNLKYSSHSLRRGFATEASRRNASLASIMRQGRWKSVNTVLEYTEDSNNLVDNAVISIFN